MSIYILGHSNLRKKTT